MKIPRTACLTLAVTVFLATPGRPALQEGDRVPDVSAPLSDGTTFHLKDWLKKAPLVVYFYPKDDTPGCTAQACGLRDDFAAFRRLKATVVGVSYDSVESHRAFIAKHRLPFPLVSDEKRAVAEAFGVAGERVAQRATFILGKDGDVLYADPAVDPRTHSRELKESLARLAPAK
jgi:peroxiredoxin Q/BCP